MPYKNLNDKLANNRKWAANNPNKTKARQKKWVSNNRDLVNAKSRKFTRKHRPWVARYANNKIKLRKHTKKSQLKHFYGLTIEQYDQMLIASCGVCDLCGLQFTNTTNEPAVDHDHSTGIVRGLLHAKCNLGIGIFKDSIDMLNKAIAYLATSDQPVGG
jgi:hypothetical protein